MLTLVIILGIIAWFYAQFTRKGKLRWLGRLEWLEVWVFPLARKVAGDARAVWLDTREELLVCKARWQMR